ncbi:hypothetical protein F4810DRAFT_696680 [Camillea tinctor]|nr:hypothetical protein F4810DRAFT_696680 [Camillea tinctor]
MATSLDGSPVRGQRLPSQGYHDNSCPESSDEDDDGIPSRMPPISPSKLLAASSARPASLRTSLKRSYQALVQNNRRSSVPDTQNELSLYPGLSKRQKLEHWTGQRGGRMTLTPNSSRLAHIAAYAPPRNRSISSSTDNDVPAIVLDALNSASRPASRNAPEQTKHPQSSSLNNPQSSEPSREIQSIEDQLIEEEDETSASEINEIGEQGTERVGCTFEMGSARLHRSVDGREPEYSNTDIQYKAEDDFTSAPNLEHYPPLDGLTLNDISVEAHVEEDNGEQVPYLPEPSNPPEEQDNGMQTHEENHVNPSFQPPSTIDEGEKLQKPVRRSSRIQSMRGQPQQALEERGGSSYVDQERNEEEVTEEEEEEDTGSDAEMIDGVDNDDEVGPDVDLSVEESFEQDVAHFRSLHAQGTNNVKSFDGPSDNDLTAIHLDYQPLRDVCKLLGHSAWAGKRVDWQWRPFSCDGVATRPGRALVSFLVKLERLYEAAPVAPKLKEQNQFLREHSDLLSYYFLKIRAVIDYICHERLASPEQNKSPQNTSKGKRRKMAQDLVQIIIPMLLRVLACAWGLGGKNRARTLFTSSTIELVQREVCWVVLVYHPLLKELERPSSEEKPTSQYEQVKRRKAKEKRKNLKELLDVLLQVVQAAPDLLKEEEVRARRATEERKRLLKKQEELQAQRKREAEAMLASIKEQKLRSLMSIRGIYYPLGTSSPSASSSLPVSSSSSFSSQRPAKSSTPSSYDRPVWSFEERVFLFEKIQESYPTLPDLKSLRLEVGKTVEEMEAMAEELLGEMLKAVNLDDTPEARRDEVRQIMRSYRTTT